MDGDGDVTVSFGKLEIKFNPECLRPSKGSVFNEDEEPHGNQGSSTDVDSVPPGPDLSRQQDEPKNRHTNRVSPTPERPPETQSLPKDDTEDEESDGGMDDISGTFLSSFMYLINGTLSLHHPENLS